MRRGALLDILHLAAHCRNAPVTFTLDRMERLGLSIETVWSDPHMLEFRVAADNGAFAGTAHFYVGLGEATQFAHSIAGFPHSPADVREYQLGNPEGTQQGGALLLFSSDGSGHVTVEARLWADCEGPVPQRVSMFLQSLPAEIDAFVGELMNMGTREGARAFLRHAI